MKKGIIHTEKPHLRLTMIGAVEHGKATLTSAIVKVLAENKTHGAGQVYEARIGRDWSARKRVTVIAGSLIEAKTMLEEEYGKGRVWSLHNREAAKKPRG